MVYITVSDIILGQAGLVTQVKQFQVQGANIRILEPRGADPPPFLYV